MIRYWLLSQQDLPLIQERRREHNRLGFAIQLCLLRYPGWPLGPGEMPRPNLLEFVAKQLDADPSEMREYPRWDETRREHIRSLCKAFGFRAYQTSPLPSQLREHLRGEALSTDSAYTLVQLAVCWLRERRVVLPALATLESLVRSVRSESERRVYQRLAIGLSQEHRAKLEKMLDLGPSHGSLLGWVRRVPRSCTPAGISDLLQRVDWVRNRGLPKKLAERIPALRIQQLAARGGRHSLSHFRRFSPEKRHAILAAFLLYMEGELTDRAIGFHNRLIGRLFYAAEKHQWAEFTNEGPAINERLHNYARLTQAMAKARKTNRDLEEAIESVMDWDTLEQEGQAAAHLAKPLNSSHFETLRAQFSQLRQYTPKFLATFHFDAIPAQQPLLKALDLLRQMNEAGRTKIPAQAPQSFIKPKWRPLVCPPSGIDRCYYELCVLSELSLGLRSGDIWVEGSRRYRKFDHYLIAPDIWAEQKLYLLQEAEPSLDGNTYLAERQKLLDEQLRIVADLTQQHRLPEARMEGHRLVISPLRRSGPDQTEEWADKVYALLPRVHLTQVLEEVNGWTQFTKMFTHLYTGQPAPDRSGLLTAILAAATNLGKTKMADATQRYTADRLAWIEDWYISEQNYGRALAEMVRRQGQIPLAAQWGTGRTSSSDGQAFPIAFRKPVIAQVNAKYGREPVAMFYTHISDRYAPFHIKAISSTVRDATHVLDGLLDHQTDLQIEEHYTDTSGYTDHLFALCHLLGFRFAPRIRDLADHRLFCFEPLSRYEALKPLLGERIHVPTIRQHWDEVARLVASLRQGITSASLLVSKLAAYPRQNHLAVTLREIGRIERSLFTLAWLQDVELRRRVTRGLNKGEAHHTLKRAVRFYRRGSVNDRTQLEQDLHAMALNLVVAAITLWNTAYLDRALTALTEHGRPVPAEYVPHISPLGWEHITLTGTYHWKDGRGTEPAWGTFRPLRTQAMQRFAVARA